MSCPDCCCNCAVNAEMKVEKLEAQLSSQKEEIGRLIKLTPVRNDGDAVTQADYDAQKETIRKMREVLEEIQNVFNQFSKCPSTDTIDRLIWSANRAKEALALSEEKGKS